MTRTRWRIGTMLATGALALAATAGPAGATSQTVAFQGDAGHSGGVVDPALGGALHVAWTDQLGEALSYPLVADGRVFVLDAPENYAQSSTLAALDGATGAVVWSRTLRVADGLTYGQGTVYVLGGDGHVDALDGATGAARWSATPTELGPITEAGRPVYAGGEILYIGTPDSENTAVYALDATTGATRWTRRSTLYGSQFGLAADAGGFYLSQECGTNAAFGLDGTPRWSTRNVCEGDNPPSLGIQAVVSGTQLFGDYRSGAVLDTGSGAAAGHYERPYFAGPPAFGTAHAAVLEKGRLEFSDRATFAPGATFTASNPDTGEILAQPFFVGDRAFTVDNFHDLVGVDAATGALAVDLDLNTQIPAAPGQPPVDGSGGIGVGGGVLVVATTDGRVVGVTGDGTTTAPPPPSDPGQPNPPSSPQPPPLPPWPADPKPVAHAASTPSPAVTAAAARRIALASGSRLGSLLGTRGLAVTVTGARSGATVHALLTVRGRTVWHTTARLPRSGHVRLRAARRTTRARSARLELRVTAAHARTLVLARTLR